MVTAGAPSRAAMVSAASTMRARRAAQTAPSPFPSPAAGLWGRRPVDVNTVYKRAAGRVGSPAMSTDLAYLSATEALARFRDRSLSPVELTEALIARAAEVEPTVNALCITYYDEALAQAREAEKRYLGQGAEPRPLEGICVGIKDEMPITGQLCSMGSLRYEDDVAEYTDPVGQRPDRRRRHPPRPHDGAGVLVRRVHALAPLGRHAQPVEPGLRRRRLVRRHRRVARLRHVDARHRLGHRRLDPDPGVLERRRRVQAAVRPRAAGAAVQPRPLLPHRPARAHRARTARCSRTSSPARTARPGRDRPKLGCR